MFFFFHTSALSFLHSLEWGSPVITTSTKLPPSAWDNAGVNHMLTMQEENCWSKLDSQWVRDWAITRELENCTSPCHCSSFLTVVSLSFRELLPPLGGSSPSSGVNDWWVAHGPSGGTSLQSRLTPSLLSDDSYSMFYNTEDYPLAKYLQEPLYFEVELMGSKNPQVSLELENCWATLGNNRTSQPRWNLIING